MVDGSARIGGPTVQQLCCSAAVVESGVLAALNAMWHYTCHVMAASEDTRNAWLLEGGHRAGGQLAVTKFRELLEEFVRVGSPPAAWQRVLPPNAPFFRYSADRTLQVIPVL